MKAHEFLVTELSTRRQTSDCWIWPYSSTADGYGQLTFQNRKLKVHRRAYELAKGPIPSGRHILHSCDTPTCYNPQHLRIGTHADNMRDKAKRGRVVVANPFPSKLTESDRKEIRVKHAKGGILQKDLAKQYGVSEALISSFLHSRQTRRGGERAHTSPALRGGRYTTLGPDGLPLTPAPQQALGEVQRRNQARPLRLTGDGEDKDPERFRPLVAAGIFQHVLRASVIRPPRRDQARQPTNTVTQHH